MDSSAFFSFEIHSKWGKIWNFNCRENFYKLHVERENLYFLNRRVKLSGTCQLPNYVHSKEKLFVFHLFFFPAIFSPCSRLVIDYRTDRKFDSFVTTMQQHFFRSPNSLICCCFTIKPTFCHWRNQLYGVLYLLEMTTCSLLFTPHYDKQSKSKSFLYAHSHSYKIRTRSIRHEKNKRILCNVVIVVGIVVVIIHFFSSLSLSLSSLFHIFCSPKVHCIYASIKVH